MKALAKYWISPAVVLAISAYQPHDYFTWLLEIFPVLIAWPLLVGRYAAWRFTALTYQLIWLHSLVLILGGHYTYAEVPLGEWAQQWFDLDRNYYDRLGHFMQGFVPAIVAREILVRKAIVKGRSWLFFVVLSMVAFITVSYEFLEWWVAIGTGEAAEDFLGTQGDVWDTQNDMFMALVGGVLAQLALGRIHDKQLKRLID